MSIRKDLEAELYDFLDDCDPSGRNTERLKKLFVSMDDKQFYRYMNDFLNDDMKNIQVGYLPYDNPVSLEFANKLAKKYNIPIYEIVYKPYLTGDTKNPPASIYPVMVVDVPIKRLKQMVMTKSHATVSAAKRDSKSGQVTGHDKVGRVTDVEAYSLVVQEMYACAQESFGPMSDDEAAFRKMQIAIQRDGEVSLKDLPSDPTDKVAMNTIEYYMLGSGVCSNLIDSSGYVLPITLLAKDDKSTTIDRS